MRNQPTAKFGAEHSGNFRLTFVEFPSSYFTKLRPKSGHLATLNVRRRHTSAPAADDQGTLPQQVMPLTEIPGFFGRLAAYFAICSPLFVTFRRVRGSQPVNHRETDPMNAFYRAVFCALLLSGATLLAQVRNAPPAPVPPAIVHARTVFLSNESADSGLIPDIYGGTADRGFNEFYAALAANRRFEIVSSPAQADLVLSLRLVAPIDVAAAREEPRPPGFPQPLPLFRLKIYDRASHYVLWTLTEPIQKALFQRNNDKNFDQAVMALAADLQRLAGPAAH